jgi:hypothetical protein
LITPGIKQLGKTMIAWKNNEFSKQTPSRSALASKKWNRYQQLKFVIVVLLSLTAGIIGYYAYKGVDNLERYFKKKIYLEIVDRNMFLMGEGSPK